MAANDIKLPQRNAGDTQFDERTVTAGANTLLGFDNTSIPAKVSIGAGLSLVGNSLSATGGGASVDVEDDGAPVGSFTTLNFTGNITAVDSGGGVVAISASGGSSYVEVANFAALPAAGSHTGEIYVCIAAQGSNWTLNLKPAGLYMSDGANWNNLAALPADYFTDNVMTFVDNADPTKKLMFQLSGITTGTTRTWTAQDLDGSVALLGNNLGAFAATTSAQLRGVISDETGTGALVFQDGALGNATATTINKLTFTQPATSATLTIADGKTLAADNTLTFKGTDSSTLDIGAGGTLGTNAFTSTAYVPQTTEVNGHALTGNVTVTASDVGLGNVTNDAQTKAAVVPNTVPSAGQILVGNAGGTAYAPVSMSSDATLASTGALTLATVNGNVGTFGSATQSSQVTVNAKGLVTAAANVTVTPAVGSITGLGAGVATFLATPSSANLAAALTDETGSGAAVFGTSPTITTPTIGAGAITYSENAYNLLDATLSADGKWTGTCIDGTAGATLAFGDLIYLAVADSRWELADADSSTTAATVLLGICVLAAAADGDPTRILLRGTVRADAAFPTFTVGGAVFVDTAAGDVTQTAPSGSSDVIRVVGQPLDGNTLYFNPDSLWAIVA